ncbi:WhiB family transcriptional regulator [Corynebacterium liangguodongii]|uniref:Uncharacterized protein n=1 Tax=Corynebacterium liangguodongii TaxID=2079535 RepID=A0A2S0WGA3_9CORY|nr:hypothetical protein C3E79_10155 [Corynebacterium liangguodongii]PWB99148.1 hypothetical protein DF219_07770 [Corynebacterium liangguodongii]
MRPPCEGHSVFINPAQASEQERADAIEMCQHCPIQRECAVDALTAGTTLDKERVTEAMDVIQAGVWLNGRRQQIAHLYNIVGLTPQERAGKRPPTPRVCLDCGRRMIPRDKSIHLTPEIITHAARGYCRTCYARRKRKGLLPELKQKHQAVLGWPEQHTRKDGKP